MDPARHGDGAGLARRGQRGLRVTVLATLAVLALVVSPASAQQDAGRTAASSQDLPAPHLFDVAWSDLDDLLDDVQPPFRPEAASWAAAPIVHLDYALETPTRLTGAAEIRLVNRSADPWSELWFQLFPNLLGGRMRVADVVVADAHGSLGVEPELEREDALLRVPLSAELLPNEALVVRMRVELEIPTERQRNYTLLAFRRGIVSLAHAYPVPAVYRDGEGWDLDPPAPHGDLVFARTAWFRARVEAPADLELVASGRETLLHASGDRRTWEVRAGPMRDLYLSLAPYRTISATVAGVEVRSHYLDGSEGAARSALDQAVRALEVFGARWTPYPYTSFDLVPIATEALGVEFPGVIALATRLYASQRADLPWVVVHEVAHQWFYGLVGNDQVTHPWLDEALAQYAVWVVAHASGGDAAARGVQRSFNARWSSRDGDVPIGLPVTAYEPAAYGSVVYGRGPLVILQLRERVGAGAFERFLRGYVASLRWGVADPQAFRTGLEAACGCTLADVFETSIDAR